MISSLRGTVHEAGKGSVVIETSGGVGYVVFVSTATKKSIIPEDVVFLYTHTVFGRNTTDIFGFLNLEEKSAFLLLTAVSGIGPKKALSILEKAEPSTLLSAIHRGDVDRLKTFGISTKSSQRIIIDLRKKIDVPEESEARSDLIAALMVFGYSKKEIYEALPTVNMNDPLEKQVRSALRNL